MNDEKKAKNCEKCKLRKSQNAYLGWIFDYKTCPFVCVENELYEKLNARRRGIMKGVYK